MSPKLPLAIASPQDLTNIILELQTYRTWLQQAMIRQKSVPGSAMPSAPDMSSVATDLLRDWSQNKPLSPAILEAVIAQLEIYEGELPVMTIILAAPATGRFKSDVIEWCRANLVENMLVRFKFDRTLLGGVVLRCGSHIYDWSFRQSIMKNADKFPEILSRV